MAKLQVALDFIDLNQALEMASKVAPFCDILEAGTPLVKSVGMESVRQLKKSFPQKEIFADLKTMDAGETEVNMALKAGANLVSVMACASNRTIISALAADFRQKMEIIFDLMGTQDKVSRASELERLGVHFIHVHSGLDEQAEGKNPLQDLKAISENTSVQLTVAGGINKTNIHKILSFPKVKIVMVGSAITKAIHPEQMAKELYNMVKNKK